MQSFKLLLKKSSTENECYSATFHADRWDDNRYLARYDRFSEAVSEMLQLASASARCRSGDQTPSPQPSQHFLHTRILSGDLGVHIGVYKPYNWVYIGITE